MDKTHFKWIMLVAVLFPLMVSYVGYVLFYSSEERQAPSASTTLEQGAAGEPVLVGKSEAAPPLQKTESLIYKDLLLYVALLGGTTALLWHYLKTNLAWAAVILLPLGFSLLYLNRFALTLTAFYLANAAFAVGLALLVKYVFFHPALIRWRMIVFSLLGAALLTLFLRTLYVLTKTVFLPGQWTQIYVPGLILFIFVSFGMSLADMLIVRTLFRERQKRSQDDDEDDGPDA